MKKNQNRIMLRDEVDKISKPSIAVLCNKSGIAHINRGVYDYARIIMSQYLDVLVKRALLLTSSAHRKTCTFADVTTAHEGMQEMFGGKHQFSFLPATVDADMKRCPAFGNENPSESEDHKRSVVKRIEYYQGQTECFTFAQEAFKRVVKETGRKTALLDDPTFERKAVNLIQMLTEEYLYTVLSHANQLAIDVADRVTVYPKDMAAVVNIMGLHKMF
jgi:histone H3/H4